METEKILRTEKIKGLLGRSEITKFDLAKKLEIARVTLDTRLEKRNWKKGEILIIKSL